VDQYKHVLGIKFVIVVADVAFWRFVVGTTLLKMFAQKFRFWHPTQKYAKLQVNFRFWKFEK